MGRKHTNETPPTKPPVVEAPIETAQAAGSQTTPATEPTPDATPKIDSNYSKPVTGSRLVLGKCGDVIYTIGAYQPSEDRANYAMTSSSHRYGLFGTHDERTLKITRKLLSAVAYGMESATVNINPTTGYLFKKDYDNLVTEKSLAKIKESRLHNEVLTKEEQIVAELIEKPVLFAEDLLKKSPEFLLERGDITDWGGRTFSNITAFEYALWAKDFKMLEMMLSCIPKTPDGDKIRAALFEQYNQVKAPIEAGGGLTYTLTYNQPNLDSSGTPKKNRAGNWQTTSVTKTRTENHFDVTPLLRAYQDYKSYFYVRSRDENDAFFIKIIGTLQRLLPIHLLQRYCDRRISVHSLEEFDFTGVFIRYIHFFHYIGGHDESLLTSSLSTDFALFAGPGAWKRGSGGAPRELYDYDMVYRVDKVSTNKIETTIKEQLTPTVQSQTQLRT